MGYRRRWPCNRYSCYGMADHQPVGSPRDQSSQDKDKDGGRYQFCCPDVCWLQSWLQRSSGSLPSPWAMSDWPALLPDLCTQTCQVKVSAHGVVERQSAVIIHICAMLVWPQSLHSNTDQRGSGEETDFAYTRCIQVQTHTRHGWWAQGEQDPYIGSGRSMLMASTPHRPDVLNTIGFLRPARAQVHHQVPTVLSDASGTWPSN